MSAVEALVSEYAAECVLQLCDVLALYLFLVVVVIAKELWSEPTRPEPICKTISRFVLTFLLMHSSEFIKGGQAQIKQSVERQIRARTDRLGSALRIEKPRSPQLSKPQP